MAPDGHPSGHRHDGSARPRSSGPDTSAAEAALKAKLSRKRTKTGCLTCRKRRIKCGEERPVCKNCIKSKRHCEGYNQRVVFKPPTYEYQPAPNGGAHIIFQVPPPPGQDYGHQAGQPSFVDPTVYGQLRPRPDGQQLMPQFGLQGQSFNPGEAVPHPQLPQSVPTTPGTQQQHFQFAPVLPGFPAQGYQFSQQTQPVANTPQSQHGQLAVSQQGAPLQQPLTIDTGQHDVYHEPASALRGLPVTLPSEYLVHAYGPTVSHPVQHFTTDPTPASSHAPHPDIAWPDVKPVVSAGHESVAQTPVSSRSSHTFRASNTPAASQQPWASGMYVPRPELTHPIDYQHNVQSDSTSWIDHVEDGNVPTTKVEHTTPEYYEHESHVTTHVTPTNILTDAAVETQDDDYFDIEPDEEMDIDATAAEQHGRVRQQTLRKILAMTQTGNDELHTRRYDTFLYEGILDKYRVEEVASPLRNPATARVFAHFISVTGPSLSIFERHPRNTSIVFSEGSIPLSQQGLWTYRMPMAALRNQGLLHAMLALASLHIARLQNASTTPSMQHYSWALRRIHTSVGNPNSRLKVTTIAASMLLGFYEVMTADHAKWNLHLAGARQLFVDTDFVKMTKDFRRLKRDRAERLKLGRKRRHGSEELHTQDDLLDQIPDVDERTISHFIGKEVRYEDHGGVEPSSMGKLPALDLSKFEILKDLYWWYCKQDVYQSIVSGNPLMMDFSRYPNCPPRAPLGKDDAVYGSLDHLVLLLGRIADFASKDRKRKLKQMEANGGQWRAAPGMNVPRPPQQGAPPATPVSATNGIPTSTPFGSIPPSPAQQPPPPPAFYGMAPPPRTNVYMPASYAPLPGVATPQSAKPPEPLDFDLQKETEAALAEYGRIRSALLTFANSLGDAFEPLTPEYQVPMETAFGTAKFYRSYDIGCLWAVYHMATIIAIRSHPNMPPASHMAAAIASHETSTYAQEIGRIAAGIVPGPPTHPLNPALGAALCESCMPVFFAAIQYHDAQQRQETVDRIWSIAQRTGWGSVELVARGCETAWVKAAAMGRGPPYQRQMRKKESDGDARVNGSWEYLDPNTAPDEGNDGDRRLVRTKEEARLTWAIGVMGVEEDVQKR